MSWICNPVAPAFVLADFYRPPCFVKFIGYVRAGPAAFRVRPVGQMEGIRFHLCASPLFHACAEGLAVADEFHVPQSFRFAAAMRLQVSRCHIASLLQLCLADGKSLLGINSVRSARQSARRFIPFNGSLCRWTMRKVAGPQNTCEWDIFRNRMHKAVQGRFCNPSGSQVGLGRATCARRKS